MSKRKPWQERRIDAEHRGYFTARDMVDAGDWGQCAIAEAAAHNPEVIRPHCTVWDCCGPEDVILDILGRELPIAVRANNIHRVAQLLGGIDDRVLELKREHTPDE